MEEWIKKSDVVKAFEDVLDCDFSHVSEETPRERIEAIPSADRPSGEWIDNGDRYFRCSLCGTKDTDRWCWCHGCGHPMKGADDE